MRQDDPTDYELRLMALSYAVQNQGKGSAAAVVINKAEAFEKYLRGEKK